MVIGKRHFVILGLVTLILLVPLIAMQFSQEVSWNWADFLIMGLLLVLTGFAPDYVRGKFRSPKTRVLIMAGILTAFRLIWIELALGIFGSPIAGN